MARAVAVAAALLLFAFAFASSVRSFGAAPYLVLTDENGSCTGVGWFGDVLIANCLLPFDGNRTQPFFFDCSSKTSCTQIGYILRDSATLQNFYYITHIHPLEDGVSFIAVVQDLSAATYYDPRYVDNPPYTTYFECTVSSAKSLSISCTQIPNSVTYFVGKVVGIGGKGDYDGKRIFKQKLVSTEDGYVLVIEVLDYDDATTTFISKGNVAVGPSTVFTNIDSVSNSPDGTLLIVGDTSSASTTDASRARGAVYFFDLSDPSESTLTWSTTKILQVPTGEPVDNFGTELTVRPLPLGFEKDQIVAKYGLRAEAQIAIVAASGPQARNGRGEVVLTLCFADKAADPPVPWFCLDPLTRFSYPGQALGCGDQQCQYGARRSLTSTSDSNVWCTSAYAADGYEGVAVCYNCTFLIACSEMATYKTNVPGAGDYLGRDGVDISADGTALAVTAKRHLPGESTPSLWIFFSPAAFEAPLKLKVAGA